MAAHKSPTKTIPTRILIISDTHNKIPLPPDDEAVSSCIYKPFGCPLPKADVLIHCGDLTMNGRDAEHENAIKLINSIDADLKIVIPGNHDITLDREYYIEYPNLHAAGTPYSEATLEYIYNLYNSPRARQAGIRYLVEGVATFKLKNGANFNVYASAYQPEFYNWAFGYPRDVDRYNPSNSGSRPRSVVPDHDAIDVMVTHGPPGGILDLNWKPRLEIPGEHCGCDHLRRAVERCKPRLHCFGHIHEAWGAVRKKWDVDSWPADLDSANTTSSGAVIESSPSTAKQNDAGATHDGQRMKPTPPFHSWENPNAYYMYPHQATTSQAGPGETLIMPGNTHAGAEVPQTCATIDARDLESGRETLFVNACIVNLKYRPANAPWVVDLMLPAAEDG